MAAWVLYVYQQWNSSGETRGSAERLSDILVLAYELGKKNCVPAVQMFNLVMPIISAVVSLKNVPLSFYLWSNQKKNDAFFLPTTESVLTSQK